MNPRLLPALALLLLCTPALAAQAIWRCGAEGRSFSDRPCSEGQMLAAPAAGPSAQAIQEAERVASRERALAEALRKERQQRQRIEPGSGLISIGPVAEPLQPHHSKRSLKAAKQADQLKEVRPKAGSKRPQGRGETEQPRRTRPKGEGLKPEAVPAQRRPSTPRTS